MWKEQTGIACPLSLLPDDCHLLEKDGMQGWHVHNDVLAYIIRNNMHMGLRELHNITYSFNEHDKTHVYNDEWIKC